MAKAPLQSCDRCGWDSHRINIRTLNGRQLCDECMLEEAALRFRRDGWLSTPLAARALARNVLLVHNVPSGPTSPTLQAVGDARTEVAEHALRFYHEVWPQGLDAALSHCPSGAAEGSSGATRLELKRLGPSKVAVRMEQQDGQHVAFGLHEEREAVALWTVEGTIHAAQAMIGAIGTGWLSGHLRLFDVGKRKK